MDLRARGKPALKHRPGSPPGVSDLVLKSSLCLSLQQWSPALSSPWLLREQRGPLGWAWMGTAELGFGLEQGALKPAADPGPKVFPPCPWTPGWP